MIAGNLTRDLLFPFALREFIDDLVELFRRVHRNRHPPRTVAVSIEEAAGSVGLDFARTRRMADGVPEASLTREGSTAPSIRAVA